MFELKNGQEVLIEGQTHEQSIEADNNKTIYNKDDIFNENLLEVWNGDEFKSQITEVGYLPPGNYQLTVGIFNIDDEVFLSFDEKEVKVLKD